MRKGEREDWERERGCCWAGGSGPQEPRSGDLEIEGVGSGSGVGEEAKEAVGIAVIAFEPVGEEALAPRTVALLLVEGEFHEPPTSLPFARGLPAG